MLAIVWCFSMRMCITSILLLAFLGRWLLYAKFEFLLCSLGTLPHRGRCLFGVEFHLCVGDGGEEQGIWHFFWRNDVVVFMIMRRSKLWRFGMAKSSPLLSVINVLWVFKWGCKALEQISCFIIIWVGNIRNNSECCNNLREKLYLFSRRLVSGFWLGWKPFKRFLFCF